MHLEILIFNKKNPNFPLFSHKKKKTDQILPKDHNNVPEYNMNLPGFSLIRGCHSDPRIKVSYSYTDLGFKDSIRIFQAFHRNRPIISNRKKRDLSSIISDKFDLKKGQRVEHEYNPVIFPGFS